MSQERDLHYSKNTEMVLNVFLATETNSNKSIDLKQKDLLLRMDSIKQLSSDTTVNRTGTPILDQTTIITTIWV